MSIFHIPHKERLMKTVLMKTLCQLLLVGAMALFTSHNAVAADASVTVGVSSKGSLVHLGSIDSFDITEGGTRAARQLLEALETGRPEPASNALAAYRQLIPSENFGGEYSALAWFCEYLLLPEAQRAEVLRDPFVKAFYDLFAEDNYSTLKEYLGRKYRLREFEDSETMAGHRRLGFLEDFILFNNPCREQWEKTSKILEALDIKPGQSIADIGSGPGNYTFKFADLVGPSGRVYAIDINFLHNSFVRDYSKRNNVTNVTVVRSGMDNIGVPDNSVDIAFSCSLYHIIYTTFAEAEKDKFIGSIRSSLKDDGRLVIVDNGPVVDETLPYHGPYIARQLIIAQLEHYGFQLEAFHQFIPQRYTLVFKKKAASGGEKEAPQSSVLLDTLKEPPAAPGSQAFEIPVASSRSLVHVPNDAVPDTTSGGREAARLFYAALESGKRDAAEAARQAFQKLIPVEKFGDEYTAFEWLCDYLIASPGQRKTMLRDPLIASYFEHLSTDDYKILKSYLLSRYKLRKKEDGTIILGKDQTEELAEAEKALTEDAYQPGADVKVTSALRVAFLNKDGASSSTENELSQEDTVFWRDLILFNNPKRESWEKSSRILESLKLQAGQAIADIGSGPGYFSFQFSKLVGPKGKVYAIDTNKRHLDYVEKMATETKADNVKVVLSDLNDIKLPENSIDTAFLCSVYSIVYAASMEKVKDEFIASIRKALKPNGRLIIVDNDVVEPPNLPYHGPYIDKRLIVAQLANYGFRLMGTEQSIPQRYVLIFEETSKKTDSGKKTATKKGSSAN